MSILINKDTKLIVQGIVYPFVGSKVDDDVRKGFS